ncbi:opacity protein-like surface antigen [Ensifer sp. 4252]
MQQRHKLPLWLGIALLAAAGVQQAQAADPYSPEPASSYQDPPAFNWSGAYVGAHGGIGFTGSPNPFADRNGVAFGAQAGYNMQVGPGIVGAEIEGSYLGDTEHKVSGGKLKEKWRGAIKAKAGLSFDQTLVYGTAGSTRRAAASRTMSASRAVICLAPASSRLSPAASRRRSSTTTSPRPMSAPARPSDRARRTLTATSSRPA